MDAPASTPHRHRRTSAAVVGAREALAIAATLGGLVDQARRAKGLSQEELGALVGLSQPRISELLGGHGAGAPFGSWIALGIAVGRPLAVTMSRGIDAAPRDAGHLGAQEFVLRSAREAGVGRTFELQTRPAPNATYIDVGLRDDRHRTLEVIEIWNRLDDIGAAGRSFRRKLAEAEQLAVVAGGDDGPYRVTGCWVVRATAANRALVARYPEVFASVFTGRSRAWVATLTTGARAPDKPGMVWIDLAASRLYEVRRSKVRPPR